MQSPSLPSRASNLPALILAAGRGERMRPLTDHAPKPLLKVRGKPLIEWHLEALARDGVRDVVINTAWLEEQFPAALGDGSRWGLRIRYSMEGRDHGGALETAGGLATALPLLQDSGADACWLVSGDIFMPDWRFDAEQARRFVAGGDLAHFVFVPNPPFHPRGDFGLTDDGRVVADAPQRWTYANIGLVRSALVEGLAAGQRMPLRPFMDRAIAAGRVSGEVWHGDWENVGTPQQLGVLNGG
ncbi:MAG: nucleotidyltransferase family protein [Burkholderiales bacterium]|nr:nucleotidyltransferase family protein [Burkholderiales bacterium]